MWASPRINTHLHRHAVQHPSLQEVQGACLRGRAHQLPRALCNGTRPGRWEQGQAGGMHQRCARGSMPQHTRPATAAAGLHAGWPWTAIQERLYGVEFTSHSLLPCPQAAATSQCLTRRSLGPVLREQHTPGQLEHRPVLVLSRAAAACLFISKRCSMGADACNRQVSTYVQCITPSLAAASGQGQQLCSSAAASRPRSSSPILASRSRAAASSRSRRSSASSSAPAAFSSGSSARSADSSTT